MNATNKRNQTALTIACINKAKRAINVLLNDGANPNIADDAHGNTCLHTAAIKECSKEVLQAIIDHRVDVNATNNRNQTALTNACINKDESAINVLLNARANPNIVNDNGHTCLHTAVIKECSIEALQAIIDHAVDVNALNKDNETALTIACIKNDESAINVLLDARDNPNIADDVRGDTCLHTAVKHQCSIEVLQAIIDHGVDVNATNKRNKTALKNACINKAESAIKVLQNVRANPNIADDAHGNTCLHSAVKQQCSIEALQAVIDHGVDVNATNKRHQTALTNTCINKDESAINVLLNARTNPNITDADGDTCLHTAAIKECSKEVLQAIIDHGVDVNATNKRNQTVLTIAYTNKDESAITVLLNARANPNIADADGHTCLHIAVIKECSIEALQAIIDHAVDVNALNKDNETALTIACINKDESAINVLLDARANPNIADDVLGDTCLHVAVKHQCSIEALQAIIDHGVDVNATNKTNTTAFMSACQRRNIVAIKLLINAGIDTNIVDNFNRTCLHYIFYGEYSVNTEDY